MRAQQIMAMADKARSQEERDALLGIARDYERLALQTEKSTDLLKSGQTKRWGNGSLKLPTNDRALAKSAGLGSRVFSQCLRFLLQVSEPLDGTADERRN